MRRRAGIAAAVGVAALSGASLGVMRGSVTVDLGVGRRMRPLGPRRIPIAAPTEVAFDVVASPYLGRTPHALAEKMTVLERGSDMVLAAHFTPTRWFTSTTVETVRFERPHRIDFRLVRWPVPYVVETFSFHDRDAGCELAYTGELGADLWAVGGWWAGVVARRWQAVVDASLESIRSEAERRAR
jgi:hypothetical protein